MLTALLFDLDGTLTDTNMLHARALAEGMAAQGFVVPVERVLRSIGMGVDTLVPDVLGPSVSADVVEAIGAAHTRHYLAAVRRERVALLPGALALLDAARAHGLKLGLATSSRQDELDATAEAAGLDLARFDAVTTASDVADAKPAPDPIRVCADQLGVSPAETALVGDTPFDAASARRAGSVLLGVANGTHTPDELRRNGARAVYRHAADLTAHLADALALASPGPDALTARAQERLMDAALAEAEANLVDGGLPIGAVVGRADGTVVARGRNLAHTTGSPVAHAELEAVRVAGRLAGRDLVLATTLEPCRMCLGAAVEARLDAVVWALDAPENGAAEHVQGPAADGLVLPRLVGGARREASRRLLARYLDACGDTPGEAAGFVRRLLAATS